MRKLRQKIARLVYRFADAKYGVDARGYVSSAGFNQKQLEMAKKWHKWMRIKNRIYDVCKH